MHRHSVLAMVSRISPANVPFITVDRAGNSFVYAEELTYGSALYLPPALAEPQSAADVICGAIYVIRENTHNYYQIFPNDDISNLKIKIDGIEKTTSNTAPAGQPVAAVHPTAPDAKPTGQEVMQ